MKHFRLFPTHLWEHEVAEKEHLNKRIVKYVLEQDTHKKNWQSKSTMYKLKEFDVLNKNIALVEFGAAELHRRDELFSNGLGKTQGIFTMWAKIYISYIFE